MSQCVAEPPADSGARFLFATRCQAALQPKSQQAHLSGRARREGRGSSALDTGIGGMKMIARVWRGWTNAENADAYETLLKEVVYPGLQDIDGYRGGYI